MLQQDARYLAQCIHNMHNLVQNFLKSMSRFYFLLVDEDISK